LAEQNPEVVLEASGQNQKIYLEISKASDSLWQVSLAFPPVKESQPSSLPTADSSMSLESNVTPLSSNSVTTPDTDSAEQSSTSSDSSAPDSPVQPSNLNPKESQSNPTDLPDTTSSDKLSTATAITITSQGNQENLVHSNLEVHRSIQSSQRKSKRPSQKKFDVFLSYNTKDKRLVEAIAVELSKREIKPWLDVWYLRPGTSWQDTFTKLLPNIRAVAVFLGPNKIGPWQNEEVKVFIQKCKERRNLSVIPVTLENCTKDPEIPPFLGDRIGVDFRNQDSEPMVQLIWGIKKTKPLEHGI